MRKDVLALIIISAVVIVGAVVGAKYYRNSVENQRVVTTPANSSSTKPALDPQVLVRPDSPTLGAPNAAVTIAEFLDPECESCAAFAPVVKKMVAQYDGKVRLAIRYMPLHPNSIPAANFLESAGEQGKYWEAQEILFRNQPEWGERHGAPPSAQPANIEALFEKYAKEAGLDVGKVKNAIKQSQFQGKIERDKRDGQTLGVRQTPTLFINGRKLLRLSEPDLKALIEDELKK